VSKKIFGKPNLRGAVAVGIDQSYSGFAITVLDKHFNYYTEVYKPEGTGVERLSNLRNYTEDFLSDYDVQKTCIEGYAFGSQMANMAGELGGMLRLLMYDLYPAAPEARFPLVVPPTSLKKYVAGKGTGVSKSQMLLAVYKKWDVDFTDDNAADSYGLARIVMNKHDFEYEKEVYDKLTSKG